MAIVGRAKYTRARKFEETRREGSAENFPPRRVSSNFRARVCISPAPQSPSPKLETTRSLSVAQLSRTASEYKLIALYMRLI